jgi:hypothetical protein
MARLRECAEESLLGDHVAPKDFLDPLRRLTAFSDTPLFDAEGGVLESVEPLIGRTHEISVLVNLDGAWLSDRSWGFKLRIVQLKVHRQDAKPPPRPPAFLPAPTAPAQGFAFQDSDDEDQKARGERDESVLEKKSASRFAFMDDD